MKINKLHFSHSKKVAILSEKRQFTMNLYVLSKKNLVKG